LERICVDRAFAGRCDFLPERQMFLQDIRERHRTLCCQCLIVKQMVQMKNRVPDPADYMDQSPQGANAQINPDFCGSVHER
jgi:hypothetical protein